MGTSKSRINEKVKRMLEGKSSDTIKTDITKITSIVLNQSTINSHIKEEEINSTFKIVAGFIGSSVGFGYKGKALKELEEDTKTRDEFLDEIIDAIELEIPLVSKLLKKALRMAMTEAIKEDLDIYIFANLFFYYFIYLLLERELADTLRVVKDEITRPQVKQIIKNIANDIFKEEVHQYIEKLVQNKVSLATLIDVIEQATQDVNLGEF